MLELSPSTLPAFRVGSLPTIAYVPDYLAAAEEASLLREIRAARRWTEVPHRAVASAHPCELAVARWNSAGQRERPQSWTSAQDVRRIYSEGSRALITKVTCQQPAFGAQVSGRRLQTHGGTVHEKKGLLQTPLPAWLARLTRRLAADTAAYGIDDGGRPLEPNHVLINAYTAEQGIMVRAGPSRRQQCSGGSNQHMCCMPAQDCRLRNAESPDGPSAEPSDLPYLRYRWREVICAASEYIIASR